MKRWLALSFVFCGALQADKAYVLGYGANSGESTIYILDTNRSLVTGVVANLPTNSDYLDDIAFTPNGKSAYVANQSNEVYVIDVESDTYVGNLVGSFDSPYNVAFAPDGKKAYVTNGGGSVSIIDVATNSVTGLVSNGILAAFNTPFGVGFSLDGSFAYVSDSGNNYVYVIDVATDTATSYVTGDPLNSPTWLTFSPDGTYVYLSNQGGPYQGVYRIDSSTHTITTKITEDGGVPTMVGPQKTAFLPNGTKAYIPDQSSSPETIFEVDTTTNNATDVIFNYYGSYDAPTQIGMTYDGLYGFVANEGGGPLYIIGVEAGTIIGTANLASGVDPISDAQAIALKPKPLAPPSANASTFKNNFALLCELYNTLSWVASDSTVVAYRIYRDGTFIGSVSGSTLQYEDHNAPKGISNYSIRAVDTSGVEGAACVISVNAS